MLLVISFFCLHFSFSTIKKALLQIVGKGFAILKKTYAIFSAYRNFVMKVLKLLLLAYHCSF